MIVSYRSLPGSGGDRPFIDVLIGTSAHRVSGLVDSGAVNGLFNTEVASEAGIDLAAAEERTILYGAAHMERTARFVVVPMACEGHTWDGEIGFADWVSLDWGLLGQAALFRWFVITFFGADSEFEALPIDR